MWLTKFEKQKNWPWGYKIIHAQLNWAHKTHIKLINVKMPTIDCILTFISMINTTSDSLNTRKLLIFQHLSFWAVEFSTQLSWAWKKLDNIKTRYRLTRFAIVFTKLVVLILYISVPRREQQRCRLVIRSLASASATLLIAKLTTSLVENQNKLELDFIFFFFADSCCSDIVLDESNWCHSGIIERFEISKMASKMAVS